MQRHSDKEKCISFMVKIIFSPTLIHSLSNPFSLKLTHWLSFSLSHLYLSNISCISIVYFHSHSYSSIVFLPLSLYLSLREFLIHFLPLFIECLYQISFSYSLIVSLSFVSLSFSIINFIPHSPVYLCHSHIFFLLVSPSLTIFLLPYLLSYFTIHFLSNSHSHSIAHATTLPLTHFLTYYPTLSPFLHFRSPLTMVSMIHHSLSLTRDRDSESLTVYLSHTFLSLIN